jgi:release factor glutamine methyltransferase
MNVPLRSEEQDSPLTTARVLDRAAERLGAVSETPRLDAEVLLALVLRGARSALHAFPERLIAPPDAARYSALVARREAGEPLAYLTGAREFFSLTLRVSPAVLVPRPETELLVETAIERCCALERPAVLDVGTGSGAVALAIKHALPRARVTGADADAAALEVARDNAAHLELDVRFVESHWLEALEGEQFDLIVSNPPYVRSADVRGPLAREPRLALDGGADGLAAYRALLATAPALLAAGGAMLLEHGHDQRSALSALARSQGWRVVAACDDLAGRARVLALEREAAP